MSQITVTKCPIEGLYIIEPTIHGDERGDFFESYNQRDLEEAGIKLKFVQENQSFSAKGVLRGLHFQKKYPQAKLARVMAGSVFDVAVDLRPDSGTFKRWYGVELSSENHKQFLNTCRICTWITGLIRHCLFTYKCTDYYHPEDEGGIAWNDPEIGVEWPVKKTADGRYEMLDGTKIQLSEKDQKWS